MKAVIMTPVRFPEGDNIVGIKNAVIISRTVETEEEGRKIVDRIQKLNPHLLVEMYLEGAK